MQRADSCLAQQRAVVAEQRAGGRVGVDDLVGMGIEQQRRLGQIVEGEGAQIEVASVAAEPSGVSSITVILREIVIMLRIFVYHEFS